MNIMKTSLGLISTTQVVRLLVRVIFWVFDILQERKGKQMGYYITALEDELQKQLDSRNKIDAV
jgi:hypothetical protein